MNPTCEHCLEEIAALPSMALQRLSQGGATEELAADIQAHLQECAPCREEARFLAHISETAHALEAPPLPADFAQRVQRAIAADSLKVAETSHATEAPAMKVALPAAPLSTQEKRISPLARWFGGSQRKTWRLAWGSGSVLAGLALLLASQIQTPITVAPSQSDVVVSEAPLSTQATPPPAPSKPKSGATKPAVKATKPAATAAPLPLPSPATASGELPPLPAPPLADLPTSVEKAAPIAPSVQPQTGIKTPSGPTTSPRPATATRGDSPSKNNKSTGAAPRTEISNKAGSSSSPGSILTAPLFPDAPKTGTSSSRLSTRKPPVKRELPISATPAPRGEVNRVLEAPLFSHQEAPAGAAEVTPIERPRVAVPAPSAAIPSVRRSPPAADEEKSADTAGAYSMARGGGAAESLAPAPRNFFTDVQWTAPRAIEAARIRLELPDGATLKTPARENVVWSGALRRGEKVSVSAAILAHQASLASQAPQIRAVLEAREKGAWVVVGTREASTKEVATKPAD